MNSPCQALRAALLDALDRGGAPFLDPRHQEHLASCEACRRLCSEEEALDALLVATADSAPTGSLDPDAAARLLTRLRADLDRALDAALDRIPAPAPPSPELLQRVLEATRAEREETLPDVELEPMPGGSRWFRPALAAAAAAVLLTWVSLRGGAALDPEAPRLAPEDTELLAWLDVLERWDELEALEPVEREALAVLDPGDALLLEWGDAQ